MATTLERERTETRPTAEQRPQHHARTRYRALDVVRGITIAGMILVNGPGSDDAIYAPLRHAAWNGWTPADLVFPFFLFIVGVTTHLSLASRREAGACDKEIARHVSQRGAILFAIGLLGNMPPDFDLDTMRIPGVLQRIAIAYVAVALLLLRTTLRTQVLVAVSVLLGYWGLLTLAPVPGSGTIGAFLLDRPGAGLPAYVDRLILGHHVYEETRVWDPEGILPTIPVIATVLFGTFAGRWLRAGRALVSRSTALFATGLLATLAGLAWGWSFPINKNLWTSSYALFTASAACMLLAACIWLMGVQRATGWATPFIVLGRNPIMAYVGSGALQGLMDGLTILNVEGRPISAWDAAYTTMYATWLAPRDASLLLALSHVLFWVGLTAVLYRRGIVLKV